MIFVQYTLHGYTEQISMESILNILIFYMLFHQGVSTISHGYFKKFPVKGNSTYYISRVIAHHPHITSAKICGRMCIQEVQCGTFRVSALNGCQLGEYNNIYESPLTDNERYKIFFNKGKVKRNIHHSFIVYPKPHYYIYIQLKLIVDIIMQLNCFHNIHKTFTPNVPKSYFENTCL